MSFIIKNYWKHFKRRYYKSYITQKKIRQLPLNEIKKIQWKRLKNLLNYTYNNNDFYRDYFESVNLNPDLIKIPSDILKLPITEKKDYIKNFNKIVTKNISKDNYAVASTSGSTGEPFIHYVDMYKEEVNTEMAFFLNMESMGIKSFERYNQLRIHFRPPNEIVNLKKMPKKKLTDRIIYSFFPQTFGIRSYTITNENYPYLLDLIKDNKIRGIYGVASTILNLAQMIDNKDTINLNYIITFGEELLNYQRHYISKIFNCPVFMDYGSSECMRMGFECQYQNGFHIDIYNYYFEFLKNTQTIDSTKRCDLIVTNLNNYVFPFIRYKTTDGVIPSDEACYCGNNLPMVNKIIGKNTIGFTTPNGFFLSSVDFAAFFEHYQKHTEVVRQFQVIQKDEKTLLIKIVPTIIYNENIRKNIENRISDLVEGSMKIEVMPVERITSEKTGKIKILILKEEAVEY